MISKVTFNEMGRAMKAINKAISEGCGKFRINGEQFFIETDTYRLNKKGKRL